MSAAGHRKWCSSCARSVSLVQPWEEAWGRGVLAYLEDAVGALDLVAGAPPGDKGAGQRGVVEVERDRVVQDAVQTICRHRPTVCTAIRIEPCAYLIDALPEACSANSRLWSGLFKPFVAAPVLPRLPISFPRDLELQRLMDTHRVFGKTTVVVLAEAQKQRGAGIQDCRQ
jgi:hypothetical protein